MIYIDFLYSLICYNDENTDFVIFMFKLDIGCYIPELLETVTSDWFIFKK